MENKIDPNPDAYTQFLWEWAKHEDELFTNRGNFFLVSESMLFAAVATLFPGDPDLSNPRENMLIFLLILAGIAISILWTFISAKSIGLQQKLKKELRENHVSYAKFKISSIIETEKTPKARSEKPILLPDTRSVHWMMGMGLSVFLALIWISVLLVIIF